MNIEEAQQLIDKHFGNNEIPDPVGYRLEKPKTGQAAAQGIKIKEKDYLVYSPISGKQGAIHTFVPKDNFYKLLYYAENLSEASVGVTKVGVPFSLSGILFSTIDLNVINTPLIRRSEERKWSIQKQPIGKGGYLLYIGKARILLEGKKSNFLMAFKEPSDIFRFAKVHKLDFSIAPNDKTEVLIFVLDKTIKIE
jgi:hypothetical protein